jgi:hypothetical protein
MATKLTLKVGEGRGPLVHVHRSDRPWVLRLRGLGKGIVTVLGRTFTSEGDFPIDLDGELVRCCAEGVTPQFSAELLLS